MGRVLLSLRLSLGAVEGCVSVGCGTRGREIYVEFAHGCGINVSRRQRGELQSSQSGWLVATKDKGPGIQMDKIRLAFAISAICDYQ